MRTKAGLERFSTVAIVLHWGIALLVIANLVLAENAEGLRGPARGALMGPHTAIGITVLLLSVLLIAWRITHRRPAYPQEMRRWERSLSNALRVVFYILIIAIPLTGWLLVSAHQGAEGIDWFGLFTVPPLPVTADKSGHELIEAVHKNFGGAMIYLIGLHVLGALKHMFIDKMPYFHRMWPS
ncbi:cytochrome b [Novosphingopyxis sp.]|uniref:cytochrome b n=1 Tax=Novosphingopyxis sp. TaxID=2709690 RepID=UPI003B5C21E1